MKSKSLIAIGLLFALGAIASAAFVTEPEWRDRGKAVGVDWTPAEIAGGRGKPAFAYKALFGRRIATELIGAGRCPVTELPNGREFELGQGVRLRVQQLAEYDLPGGGKVAPPFGVTRRIVVLPKLPATNSWRFRVTLPEGARLIYQPELTQAEKDAGNMRPAHVVGSYAARTAGGLKLGHYYRPVAVDANGAWTWGELAWDAQSKTLTKTIPAAWLATAAYPVEADESFGYTDAGLSSSNHGDDTVIYTGGWICIDTGNATSVKVYILRRTGTGAADITHGFYDDTLGEPDERQADGDASATFDENAAWVENDLDASTGIIPQDYWIATCTAANPTLYYDAGTHKFRSEAYVYQDGVLPASANSGNEITDVDYSFYVIYTPAAEGPSLPVVLHHYRQQGIY